MPTKKGSTSETRQETALRKKIAALKIEMKKTGKRYLICETCGKKGPLIAHTDAKSGHLILHLENSRLQYWAHIVVAPEDLELSNYPIPIAFQYMTLCPQCAKARRKQISKERLVKCQRRQVLKKGKKKVLKPLSPKQRKFLEDRRQKRRRPRDYDGSRRVTI